MARDPVLKKLVARSRRFARQKAKDIRKEKGSRGIKLAEGLWDGDFGYGFETSIMSGRYAQFPHELKGKVECVDLTLYNFMVAEALGLKPRAFFVYDIKSHPDDADPMEYGSYDHAFIDIDIGRKQRLIMDRQLSCFGFVRYDKFKRTISVNDNHATRHTKRKYTRLDELTLDNLLEKVMYIRSTEGSIRMLEQGQRTGKTFFVGKSLSYLHLIYDEDSDTLSFHLPLERPLIANDVLIQNFHFDDKGNRDSSSLVLGKFSEINWFKYKDYTQLGEFDMADVKPFFDTLDMVLSTKYPNSTRRREKPTQTLVDYVADCGLENFDFDPSKLPAELKTQATSIKQSIDAMEAVVEQEYQKIPGQENFELLERGLLVSELYRLAVEERKQKGQDHDGYLYSQEVRDERFIDMARKTTSGLAEAFRLMDEKEVFAEARIGNKSGSSKLNHSFEQAQRERVKARQIMWLRRHDKKTYDIIMDKLRYSKTELKDVSTDELRASVEQKGGDPLDAYKRNVFRQLVLAYQAQPILNHRQYLPRISRKIKEYKTWCHVRDEVEQLKDPFPPFYEEAQKQLHGPFAARLLPTMKRTIKFLKAKLSA